MLALAPLLFVCIGFALPSLGRLCIHARPNRSGMNAELWEKKKTMLRCIKIKEGHILYTVSFSSQGKETYPIRHMCAAFF